MQPDKLQAIFEMQRVLNERIGVKTDEMNEEQQAHWVLNYVRAMQQEQAELVDSVPWKWWARYQKFDKQNARVEVVDLFHFLVSVAQVLGMTADDVYDAYVKKNAVNHNRQESGYSVKDADDSKHI
jgi:dimeric dUTPase (all-alpha-NTP-PPase superfamily)